MVDMNLFPRGDHLCIVLSSYLCHYRFHGGYCNVWGECAVNTFIDLTGGITESIKTKDTTVNQLFSRIKGDLARGSIIACTLPVSTGSRLNSLVRNSIVCRPTLIMDASRSSRSVYKGNITIIVNYLNETSERKALESIICCSRKLPWNLSA